MVEGCRAKNPYSIIATLGVLYSNVFIVYYGVDIKGKKTRLSYSVFLSLSVNQQWIILCLKTMWFLFLVSFSVKAHLLLLVN